MLFNDLYYTYHNDIQILWLFGNHCSQLSKASGFNAESIDVDFQGKIFKKEIYATIRNHKKALQESTSHGTEVKIKITSIPLHQVALVTLLLHVAWCLRSLAKPKYVLIDEQSNFEFSLVSSPLPQVVEFRLLSCHCHNKKIKNKDCHNLF